MKTRPLHLVIFLFAFLYSNFSSATIYTAIDDLDWNNPNTWNPVGIPNSTDTVLIDGVKVSLNIRTTIGHIILTNDNGAPTSLTILDTLTVLGEVSVDFVNEDNDIELLVKSEALFTINGDVNFTRDSKDQDDLLRFKMFEDSKTYILGDFTFDYINAENDESNLDIITDGNALLDVRGMTTLITRDGNNLDFEARGNSHVILGDSVSLLLLGGKETAITVDENALLEINANVYMLNSGGSKQTKLKAGETSNMGGTIIVNGSVFTESTASGLDVRLESANTNGQFTVTKNIILDAVDDTDAVIDLTNGGALSIGETILRPNNYGALKMADGTSLTFNGTTTQAIPERKLPGSGNDSLYYRDIYINNTSPTGISLKEDMVIEDSLKLTKGKLMTSNSALLILEDQATITGGSDSAYVVGPMVKMGRTNGGSFVFPIGSATTYAPIEISEVTKSNSEIQAAYFSDPPPWGTVPSLNNVSTTKYWEIDKNDEQDVNATIHWTNGAAQGITSPDDLVVVRLDETNVGSEIWENYGNSATTGTAEEGSVTSALTMSDPPPWGTVKFTLGSISALNSLPVELTNFSAVQQKNQVYLQWETASEQNTREFVIEHSIDGVSFSPIGKVFSNGNSTIDQRYNFSDVSPSLGMNYYRLKINDLDGFYEYSHIEVVNFESTPTFRVYPNPVKKMLHIEGEGSEEKILEIFDRNGQRLFMEKIDLEDGTFQVETESVNIKTDGTYFLRLTGRAGSKVLKFIKMD